MRILVADDDLVSRTKLEVLLEAHGQCDTAKDGDQAWDSFQKAHQESKPYDLITMDIDMPGMNGHEVVAKIRQWEKENTSYETSKEAKILMVTSMQSRTDAIASFREGCECFIRKPIKPDDLTEALEKLGILKSV
jgi:two-component system chemotaxis response regulator CheY